MPNLDGRVDWARERDRVQAALVERVAALGYPVDVELERFYDPLDWEAAGMERGTPFSLAHTFRQTGPFRPANVDRRVPGLVFTGSGTVPGVGVPMVLISGRLAADRVDELAADGRSGGRAGPADDAAALARGHARRVVRALPAAQPAPRDDLLLVDHAPAEGEAPPRPRALRVLPVRRRHRGRAASQRVDGTPRRPSAALADFGQRFFADLERGRSDDPVLKAVVHTVRAFDIDPDCFRRFLRSMTMDLTVTRYESWKDLRVYMDGSAAVIGEMMLPILEPLDPAAAPHARDLGDAFQLTNFLRDVAEDLDRGRVYLPQEDLRRYDADPSRRQVTPEWTALMRFEIGRCRRLYVSADIGIGMLPPQSARCVRAARVLYSRILDVIEEQGYDVFTQRARVPTWQKAALVARHLRRAS